MHSIRARFALVSLIGVGLLLLLAGFVFVDLFSRSLERRLDEVLDRYATTIIGDLRITPGGAFTLSDRQPDSRFEEPLGGLYWQIVDDRGTQLRSQSLWDIALNLPAQAGEPGAILQYRLKGPGDTTLLAHERVVVIGKGADTRRLRVVIAMDTASLVAASRAFMFDIIPYMAILAAVLVGLSALQSTVGLHPLVRLNQGLDRIRRREADRLEGVYPTELQATAAAVNRLLDEQSRTIEKARARAGDLAHGLKTPLTVLSNDAQTLIDRGDNQLGQELAHIADVMQAHVHRELTRSRIAINRSARKEDALLASTVANLVRTLKRTPNGEVLEWTVEIAENLTVPVDPIDLSEMLGNILENASKWARKSVDVRATRSADGVQLTIADDGPGVEKQRLRDLSERGLRLDMRMPGHGLGLSIVQEIAEVYGITLRFRNGDAGGLEVDIGF